MTVLDDHLLPIASPSANIAIFCFMVFIGKNSSRLCCSVGPLHKKIFLAASLFVRLRAKKLLPVSVSPSLIPWHLVTRRDENSPFGRFDHPPFHLFFRDDESAAFPPDARDSTHQQLNPGGS